MPLFPPSGTQIRNTPIATTPPIQGAVLVYSTTDGKYDVRPLTLDDVLPGFAITGFSGGSTVETGATVTNPSFTASYNSTPVSAQITNTDGLDSPLALISPFTSGTVIGAFHHTSPATVTFTLTAVSSSTKTASTSITFLDRTFAGIGGAGATGATASGTTAILVGASGTLSSQGLLNSIVGQSFGPFVPSSQKIYVLTQHTATPHTFHDQFGFGFPMNAPTTFSFTNQNGAVISMDLYESTNILSSTFTLSVIT